MHFLGSTLDLLIQTLSGVWEAECQQTIQVNFIDVNNSKRSLVPIVNFAFRSFTEEVGEGFIMYD